MRVAGGSSGHLCSYSNAGPRQEALHLGDGDLRTRCPAALAGNTEDFQRPLWDPLNSSSICGMLALPWNRPSKARWGSAPLPPASLPPPRRKPACSSHRGDSESCQRARWPVSRGPALQPPRVPGRDADIPCRAAGLPLVTRLGRLFPPLAAASALPTP